MKAVCKLDTLEGALQRMSLNKQLSIMDNPEFPLQHLLADRDFL